MDPFSALREKNAGALHTNPFSDTDKQYQNSASTKLILPTQDTRYIVNIAIRLLKEIFKEGFNCHKCGIVLSAIQSEGSVGQTDLFNDNPIIGNAELMTTTINRKYPKSLRIATAGFDNSWKAKSNRITQRYTTDWDNLVEVR